jgi:serine/threonine-protein kinase
MDWVEGQELQGGKYVIEKKLGSGGFGITYKALHRSLAQYVVIKKPNEKLKSKPDYAKYVALFSNEAQLLARLWSDPHPHIVRVSDFFTEKIEEEDIPCLVMDFIPGKSLWDFVRDEGALPETEAVKYICQIGSALTVVHNAGLVHRDVKPDNIMLRNSGKAVLIDFGIAREMFPPTITSKQFFNWVFAPYEQRKGIPHPTMDIYTLAASLYYGVTGQCPTNPFDRNDGVELVPPQQLVPNISNELNRAILQGMALKASDRPQSIEEWLKLLPSGGVSQTPSIQQPSSQASTPPPQKLRSISWGWLTGAFSLISWSTLQGISGISLKAKNYVQSKARRLFALNRRYQQTKRIPWGWLTVAFIGHAFVGLLPALSPSPSFALAGIGGMAVVGAVAGVVTGDNAKYSFLRVLQALALSEVWAVPVAFVGAFYALFTIFVVGLVPGLLDVFAVIGLAGAKVMSSIGAGDWAEAWAKSAADYEAWSDAGFKTLAVAVAWVWAVAGNLVLAWVWAVAGTVVLAVAGALAWVGEELLKSFSCFNTFLILTGTAGLGLGLGWLVSQKF